MKICAISDIHGHLIDIPECDVLCIAGDVVDLTVQRNNKKSDEFWFVTFVSWVDKLPCKKVIVTPGNHDIYIENVINNTVENINWQDFKDKMSALTDDKVVFLVDELYKYEGVTFYGTPWIEPIHWQKWAFEDFTSVESPFEKIPKCDILITHDNPNYNERLEFNCFGKYKHHFFGHWHDGISYGHLNQYNCSILSDTYMPRERLKIVTIDYDGN